MTSKILILDDDQDFGSALLRSFSRYGYDAQHVTSIAGCKAAMASVAYDYITVDMNLGGESGLDAIALIHTTLPDAKMIVLTGYASIATAVSAMKMGAFHYLTKPASGKDVLAVIEADISGEAVLENTAIPQTPTPLIMHEWEQIQLTLEACGYNISETAKKLGIHRRTLQRKLQKRGYR